MAITNHERVGKMLDLLRSGLGPFAEREFRNVYADQVEERIAQVLGDGRKALVLRQEEEELGQGILGHRGDLEHRTSPLSSQAVSFFSDAAGSSTYIRRWQFGHVLSSVCRSISLKSCGGILCEHPRQTPFFTSATACA